MKGYARLCQSSDEQEQEVSPKNPNTILRILQTNGYQLFATGNDNRQHCILLDIFTLFSMNQVFHGNPTVKKQNHFISSKIGNQEKDGI